MAGQTTREDSNADTRMNSFESASLINSEGTPRASSPLLLPECKVD